ncbi:MAG: MSHA biogenesis protein MshI [Flavobacteriales bacterium]|jgi:MSHA biogenesis protein MshI
MGEKPGIVGLELRSTGFSAAFRRADDQNVSALNVYDSSLEGEQAVSMSEALESYVRENNLAGRNCNVVLPCSDYQLLLVEAPEVPADELREAIRWKVKDLISISAEQAAVDVFSLPKDASRNGKDMLYVAVTEREKIANIVELINGSGLKLNAIDIEELSLGHLVDMKENSRGSAYVHIRDNTGLLGIYRGGNLYLSRQFRLDYNGGLLDDLPAEALALEIQRSLDYFERQMGQAPPSILYVSGYGIGGEKITDELRQNLAIPLQFYDYSQSGIVADDIDEGMAQLSSAAIGVCHRAGVA